MEMIRLDKFLATQLNISRNDAKKLIKSGDISIGGVIITDGNFHFDAESSEVKVKDKSIIYKKHIYIMLNKPQGIVSASSSPDDINVIDLVPDELKRAGLFPAGRLDKDTTGFVLITDDGEFAHEILSPAKHISKTYLVWLQRDVTTGEKTQFENGMDLGDIILKPASLKRLDDRFYEIVLTEGRYHQIKRMFQKTGNKVLALKRIKMGDLFLDDSLAEGDCREITSEELNLVKKLNNK